MALNFTVDELVSRVQSTVQIATDNGKADTATVIKLVDEEIQQNLYPRMLTNRDDYDLAYTQITMTAGIKQYRLPFHVPSGTVDHVEIIQLSGSNVISAKTLARIEVPHLAGYAPATSNVPNAYAVAGDVLIVGPTPSTAAATSYRLVVWHENRPSRLVANAECAVVSAFSVASTEVSMTLGVTAASLGLGVGSWVEVVPNEPPLMPYCIDAQITNVAADPTIRILPLSLDSTTLVSMMQVGCFLTPRGKTCVFPLPDVWWNAAILAGAASVCRVLGDNAGVASIGPAAEEAMNRCVSLQASRVRKQPHSMVDWQSPQRRVWNGPWFPNPGSV